MKIVMTNLLLLLSILSGIARAGEDCMVVDFPEHVELVCSGDGLKISESEQKLLQDRMATPSPVTQYVEPVSVAAKNKPAVTDSVQKIKPEDAVIIPKTLQLRLDRAAATMERMRLQTLQRNTDPSTARITPSP